MKKLFIILTLAMTLAVSVFTVASVSAQGARYEVSEKGSVVVGNSVKVNGALFGAGEVVNVAGSIDGDVYCAGQEVVITGTVYGDVICAGQTVRIQGTVNGDVRVAGQTIMLDGNVAGSVSAFGESIQIGPEGVVGRDFNGAGQRILIHGEIARDLLFAGQAAVIDGAVGRDITGNYEKLIVNEGAVVGGDAIFKGNNVDIATGSVVGTTDYLPLNQSQANVNGFVNMMRVLSAASLIVLALALILLFPAATRRMTDVNASRFVLALFLGAGVLMGTPVVATVIAFTFIGFPVGLMMMLLWVIGLILALPVVSYYFGRLILSRSKVTNSVAIMAVGALVTVIAVNLPWIGSVISFFGIIVGVGLLSLALASYWPKPTYKVKADKVVSKKN